MIHKGSCPDSAFLSEKQLLSERAASDSPKINIQMETPISYMMQKNSSFLFSVLSVSLRQSMTIRISKKDKYKKDKPEASIAAHEIIVPKADMMRIFKLGFFRVIKNRHRII